MANYSVATTKDNLSSLIDKALAGEEVVITRHGKPTVELRVVATPASQRLSKVDWSDRLGKLRESMPMMKTSAVDVVRAMRGEHGS